jgi:hypothetical protein
LEAMAAFKIDLYDSLMDSLRFTLERIAKSDICHDEGVAAKDRLHAHARLREIGVQSVAAGVSEAELYTSLIRSEESRIDFETEQAGG